MLSHGNFVANSAAVTAAWRWTPEDELLLVLLLFHMHGLGVGLHGTLLTGSSLTLHRRFEPEAVLTAMRAGEVTMFFGVLTTYARLLEVAKARGDRPRRLLVSGSAPLSPQTHREVEDVFGQRILERYGMTETVMNLGNPYDGERRGLHRGRLVQDRRPGLRGRGRLRDHQRARQGPHHFGGFNVYPREVEEVVAEVPGVQEMAVVGLPDADLGEKVVAVVVGEAASAVILEHCRARIASFKKPREVRYAETLPRNALGKVQKHLLKAQLGRVAEGEVAN